MKRLDVLVIDDNQLIRFTTAMLLKQLQMDTRTAHSGLEGLKFAHEHKPDVILLDIMMPDMDGWAVLKEIENDPELSSTPVILFTALEQNLFTSAANSSNVKTILQKPFHLEELSNAIKIATQHLEAK